ncbi:MAG: hypothetical protein CL611_02140 [Anaerolineaceae bacterium]|jgi:FMN phosphatase YigB (HAD superfamily)|nr:hypothetical protein [Anaerolineaceae bacterium]|tara:strand:+ start:4049 stop:4789 length:741 start_codon:yes stop_codon:yes gene_type:complete
MIKAILFDFNDTLIQSRQWMALETRELPHAAFSSLERTGHLPSLSEHQLAKAQAVFQEARQTANCTHRETSHIADLVAMINALGYQQLVPHATIETTVADLHKDCVPTAKLLAHTEKALERLASLGLKMGIISNAAYAPFLLWTLDHFGIMEFFEDVVVSADVGVRKPALEIFQIALSRMKLEPHRTAYVGDDYAKDIVPSRRLGLRTIWRKPRTVSSASDRDTIPDAVITSNDDIPVLAEQWMLS